MTGDARDQALEAARDALLAWQAYGCPDCGGDCHSANPPMSACIMIATREALELIRAASWSPAPSERE